MKPTHKLLTKVGAIVVSVFSMSMLAQASSEIEPNSPASSAQTFAASSSELNVSGSLTYLGFDPRRRQPIRDVDFYSFFAFAGDSIDIGVNGVRSSVALFGVAPGYAYLASGDASSRMSGHTISESGMYTVAVANSGAFFSNGGTVGGGAFDQGAYSLSVSGMSMPSMEISIDVKPRRHKKVARIKLKKKKKRKVKVAILGEDGFDVANIDQSSLTFGAYGDEKTLRKCKRRLKDVNRDGNPDLVCKFWLRDTGFDADSNEAVLKGRTKKGKQFYGTDRIAVKDRRRKKDDRDDDDRDDDDDDREEDDR